jgi:hypothetical protein
MTKKIINVTTYSKRNKDFEIWGLDPQEENCEFFPREGKRSDKRILVLRGSVLREEDERGEPKDLTQFESEINDFISGLDGEALGVLYHPGRWKEKFIQMLDIAEGDLSFFCRYSAELDTPYEKYYKPLAEARDGQEERTWKKDRWEERFEKLWAYCEGNPVLEAKLNLLHELLVPPSDLSALEAEANGSEENGAWTELRQIAQDDSDESKEDLESVWKEFKSTDLEQYSDDPSGSRYYDKEGPLSKLRDKLLASSL